jgi:hypothetical protein
MATSLTSSADACPAHEAVGLPHNADVLSDLTIDRVFNAGSARFIDLTGFRISPVLH